MSKILNIFKSVEQNHDQSTNLMENLLSDNCDLPLSSEEALVLQNLIITVINTRLNHSVTRPEGLKILLRALPRCSKEQLSKFSFLWMGKATKLLENPQTPPKDVDLSCKALSKLVILCKEIPELQKQISMQCVKNLVTLIVNMNDEKRTGGTFFIIATLLSHYGESCERHQSSIRNLLISQIDNKSRHLVQAAANCFALLSKATERSFKPPVKFPHYTSAVYYQTLICNDLHMIMDNLFSGILELDTVDIWESLNLPYIPQEDVIEYYNKVERRFKNLCIYLTTILRGCSGKNSVSCSTIMKLLCRGLAVTPENLQREDSYKNQILHVILPTIQMGLFNVLNAFICGFQRELVPFALTILQLYRQTLKWTRKIEEVNQMTVSGCRPFRNIRISVYRSLSLWLNCLGSLSGVDMIAPDILPDIIGDVIPEKDQVLLTIQNTQSMSKKAFKKFKNNQYEHSTALGGEDSEQKIERNPVINADLCREALNVVQNILYNSGVMLESMVHRGLQKLVVNLLLDFYLGRDNQSLYSKDSKCRLKLLKTLRAIQMNPNPLTAPPTQYSVEIFQMAINDEDNEIVAEARVALAEIEKIVHSSAATLDFPVELNQDENLENSEWVVGEIKNDAVDRKRNIVRKIDDFKDSIKAVSASSGKVKEHNLERKKMNVVENGMRDKRHEVEVIKGLGDDDVEVIEQAKEPPRKQRKIQIIEDICLPALNYVPLKTPSIEEIPHELPEKCSPKSYDTIQEAQRVCANSSMSSDQPIEIIKEISVSKEINILKDEFKHPRGDAEGSDDDEVILSMFCDQIKE